MMARLACLCRVIALFPAPSGLLLAGEEGSLTYTGRVVDLDGRPIGGAWVEVQHEFPPAQSMTICSGTGKWWDWARHLLREKEVEQRGEPVYREGLTDAAGRFEVKEVPLPAGALVAAGRAGPPPEGERRAAGERRPAGG